MPYIEEDLPKAVSTLEDMARRLELSMPPGLASQPGVQALLFGRGIVTGGMLVRDAEERLEAFLVAETERAARDLLSWFPHGRTLLLHIPQRWASERARLSFNLEPSGESLYTATRRTPSPPEGAVFAGKVDSQKHPAVDTARRLQTERGREETGLYAAHGPLLLARAFAANAPVEYVLYTPKMPQAQAAEMFERLHEKRIPHYLITEGLMRKCVDTAYVPEVLCILKRQVVPVDQLYLGPSALVLVAESVEEAGNLGMILRSADAVAGDAVAVCGTGSDPFAWKTVTGSRGSIFRVPTVFVRETAKLLPGLKEKGCRLIGADLSGDKSHFELDYRLSTAFLVGNESDGLTQTALELCDVRTRIPMPGEPDSLNVGVSASVLLYEALRQRM